MLLALEGVPQSIPASAEGEGSRDTARAVRKGDRGASGEGGGTPAEATVSGLGQGGDHSLPDRSGAHLWSRRATFFPPRMRAFLPYGAPFSTFFYRAGPPEILG